MRYDPMYCYFEAHRQALAAGDRKTATNLLKLIVHRIGQDGKGDLNDTTGESHE